MIFLHRTEKVFVVPFEILGIAVMELLEPNYPGDTLAK